MKLSRRIPILELISLLLGLWLAVYASLFATNAPVVFLSLAAAGLEVAGVCALVTLLLFLFFRFNEHFSIRFPYVSLWLDGFRYLAWFCFHSLLWVGLAFLLASVLLRLFGVSLISVTLVGSLTSCGIYSLMGLLWLTLPPKLSLGWVLPTSYTDSNRVISTIFLRNRFAAALNYDLENQSYLSRIRAILEHQHAIYPKIAIPPLRQLFLGELRARLEALLRVFLTLLAASAAFFLLTWSILQANHEVIKEALPPFVHEIGAVPTSTPASSTTPANQGQQQDTPQPSQGQEPGQSGTPDSNSQPNQGQPSTPQGNAGQSGTPQENTGQSGTPDSNSQPNQGRPTTPQGNAGQSGTPDSNSQPNHGQPSTPQGNAGQSGTPGGTPLDQGEQQGSPQPGQGQRQSGTPDSSPQPGQGQGQNEEASPQPGQGQQGSPQPGQGQAQSGTPDGSPQPGQGQGQSQQGSPQPGQGQAQSGTPNSGTTQPGQGQNQQGSPQPGQGQGQSGTPDGSPQPGQGQQGSPQPGQGQGQSGTPDGGTAQPGQGQSQQDNPQPGQGQGQQGTPDSNSQSGQSEGTPGGGQTTEHQIGTTDNSTPQLGSPSTPPAMNMLPPLNPEGGVKVDVPPMHSVQQGDSSGSPAPGTQAFEPKGTAPSAIEATATQEADPFDPDTRQPIQHLPNWILNFLGRHS